MAHLVIVESPSKASTIKGYLGKLTKEQLSEIITMIKTKIEETPPELSADIFDYGIVLVGGGAMIPGIGEAVHRRTGVRVTVAKHPLDCGCLGLGQMLKSTGGDFSEFVKYKVR